MGGVHKLGVQRHHPYFNGMSPNKNHPFRWNPHDSGNPINVNPGLINPQTDVGGLQFKYI